MQTELLKLIICARLFLASSHEDSTCAVYVINDFFHCDVLWNNIKRSMMNSLPPTCDIFKVMEEGKVKTRRAINKALTGDKSRFFFSVVLDLPTDKKVILEKINSTMTIKQLKLQIESLTGIPGYIQRIRYLDDYDLEDNCRLSYFHVVPGATIKVLLWPEWKRLIKASSEGDYYGVLECGLRDSEPVQVHYKTDSEPDLTPDPHESKQVSIQEPKPVPKLVPKSVSVKEHRPDSKPVSVEEPKSVSKLDHKQVSEQEPKPVPKSVPKSVSLKERKQVSSKELKPVSKQERTSDPKSVHPRGTTDSLKVPMPVPDPTAPKKFNDKATVALYMASHQGHMFTVSRLVEAGVDPCKVLPSGKSPIHVAVERKHVTCVSILIGLSQGLETQKSQDDNAIRKSTFTSVATLLKKKSGWRKIVHQRDQRKKRKEDKTKLPYVPRREFQKCDSAFPTHLTGTLGRLYFSNILQTDEPKDLKKRFEKPWV